MKKINLKIVKTVTMISVYGKTSSELLDFFLFLAEKEVNSLNKSKLTNIAMVELWERELFFKIKKIKRKLNSLFNGSLFAKKVIYDTFHSVFRNYRWADSAGSERDTEMKVWILSSIDKFYKSVEILENEDK